MAGQKSPKRLEEFGSPSLDFGGAIFFAGLFAGHFAGLSPASLALQKAPREEPTRLCLSDVTVT